MSKPIRDVLETEFKNVLFYSKSKVMPEPTLIHIGKGDTLDAVESALDDAVIRIVENQVQARLSNQEQRHRDETEILQKKLCEVNASAKDYRNRNIKLHDSIKERDRKVNELTQLIEKLNNEFLKSGVNLQYVERLENEVEYLRSLVVTFAEK